jgi:hypothetical protein
MQWFHAKPVTREEECLLVSIPQRKGEHSPESIDARGTPRLPRMDDYFSIASGVKHMTKPGEIWNELLKIVDLAVEHYAHRAVFVIERLLARREVDD